MSATPRREVILIAIINIIGDFKGHTHTPKLDHIMSVRMCVCIYVDGDVCNYHAYCNYRTQAVHICRGVLKYVELHMYASYYCRCLYACTILRARVNVI